MLQRFFILCSGSDIELLNSCSNAERNRYAGVGATVFFTALMAFLSSSYALYTVFDNLPAAIGFGFIWGLLIFNLDRYIVSTIKKTGRISNELLQASPRILLAIVIAVVISKPLELKIFEKEINRVLLEQKNDFTLANKNQIAEQFNPNIERLKAENRELQNAIAAKEQEVNQYYETFIAEAEGREGTMLVGKGPVYKEKREKHDAALAELQQLRTTNQTKITGNESEIQRLSQSLETAVVQSQPVIDNFDGLMARVNALGALPWFPSFFIFLLFLAIETAPILAKLLAPKGEYDVKLQEHESKIQQWATQKAQQRATALETDNIINDRVYTDISNEEELYAYKRRLARDLLKQQQNAFYSSQRRIL